MTGRAAAIRERLNAILDRRATERAALVASWPLPVSKLGAGLYRDGAGTLHVFLRDWLHDHGYFDTETNRRLAAEVLADMAEVAGLGFSVSDDPQR